MMILFAVAWATAALGGGTVCVDPVTITPEEQSRAFNPTDTFVVAIDSLPTQMINTNTWGVFTNLDVTIEHIVVIKRNGKPEASFRFNFKTEGSDHLRLWFRTQYQTWQLWKPGRKHECAYLKKHGASNQVPEDTARKLADPQH
jgi:hypothetical protein